MAVRKSYIGSGKEYIRYSPEELEAARKTDMIDFLGRVEGFTFKRTGTYYQCREHNSLVIYPNRQLWCWNSQDLKGLNCLDWLQKVRGLSFQESCKYVIGDSDRTFSQTTEQTVMTKKEFVEPEKTDTAYKRTFMYLTKTRCIDPDIVNYCFKKHIIYQDQRYNAVFAGYDEKGKMRFAEIKGTNSNVQYRGNVTGSDKSYSFHMDSKKGDDHKLYVFEAPIDLLSHCTLTLISEKNKALINNRSPDLDIWKKQNRLSLSGTSDVALRSYLERHKDITDIVLCLDNDEAGNKAVEVIKEFYGDRYRLSRHVAKNAKDYNEVLQNYCRTSSMSEEQTLANCNTAVAYKNAYKR